MVQPVDPVTSALLASRDLEETLEVQDHLGRGETLECRVIQERTEHLELLVRLGTRGQRVQLERLDCRVQPGKRVRQGILGLEVTLEVLDLRGREEIQASRVPKGILDLEGPQVRRETLDKAVLLGLKDPQGQLGHRVP